MNTAKMKRAFHSCYLVPKYNLTTSRDRVIELFCSSFLLFFYQRTWSNTEQGTTCSMYRNDTFPLNEKRPASVSYHGNSLASILISNKESQASNENLPDRHISISTLLVANFLSRFEDFFFNLKEVKYVHLDGICRTSCIFAFTLKGSFFFQKNHPILNKFRNAFYGHCSIKE